MTRNFTGKFFLCQGLTVSVFPYRITLLGSKQTMSISENNQKSFNSRDLTVSVPPCKYEDVVLYYQEKANIYCEPFQEIFMGKNFYDEEDI